MTRPPLPASAKPCWEEIDTVFLDMDGTLLDLHYDNTVWNEVVPRAFAEKLGVAEDLAKQQLLDHMREIYGSIEFYCFDYWRNYTDLDLVALHRNAGHMVGYRPGALEFLRWLRRTGRRAIIATNAHRESVLVKDANISICDEVDAVVSSHDYAAPKESEGFWEALQAQHPFDRSRAFFADDNEPVLDHAANHGITHLWSIVTPDSSRPARNGLRYPCFDDFREIYPKL